MYRTLCPCELLQSLQFFVQEHIGRKKQAHLKLDSECLQKRVEHQPKIKIAVDGRGV